MMFLHGLMLKIHKIRKCYAHTVVNLYISFLKYNKHHFRSSDHERQSMLLKHMYTHSHNVLNRIDSHPKKDC